MNPTKGEGPQAAPRGPQQPSGAIDAEELTEVMTQAFSKPNDPLTRQREIIQHFLDKRTKDAQVLNLEGRFTVKTKGGEWVTVVSPVELLRYVLSHKRGTQFKVRYA